MKRHQSFNSAFSIALSVVAVVVFPVAGICQTPKIIVKPEAPKVEVHSLTSTELKDAIGTAALRGEIEISDAAKMINKISDMETLMEQFEFIRDHERRMVTSSGAMLH